MATGPESHTRSNANSGGRWYRRQRRGPPGRPPARTPGHFDQRVRRPLVEPDDHSFTSEFLVPGPELGDVPLLADMARGCVAHDRTEAPGRGSSTRYRRRQRVRAYVDARLRRSEAGSARGVVRPAVPCWSRRQARLASGGPLPRRYFIDGGAEPVAAARERSDDVVLLVVAGRTGETDRALQRALGGEAIRPERVEELLLLHDAGRGCARGARGCRR